MPILPLALGNTWNVKITDADSIPMTAYDSIYVVKDTTIQNEQWYQVLSIHIMGRNQDYLINRSDGLHQFVKNNSPQFSLSLKSPAEKGDEFKTWDIPMIVLSISDTVQVPAGKFICYHYGYGNSPYYLAEYWYAPNIGLVKEEEYTLYQNVRNKLGTIELVSYKIN